jgi:hypothetical protein
MTQNDHDRTRRKIQSAMDRLLEGNPLHSTGRLNVSQLAIEAGVPRWRLTHQHVDLKELFQARLRSNDTVPARYRNAATALEALRKTHRELLEHCAELEQRNRLYANVIQLLSLERQAAAQGRPVSDLTERRQRP